MRVRDLLNPTAYVHACTSDVPIELEALSYHSCPFVRARVAARTTRPHVVERLAFDRDPSVVYNAIENELCPASAIRALSSSLAVHESPAWHVVWEVLACSPHVEESVRELLVHKERERRRTTREKLELPPLPEFKVPEQPALGRFSERRLILSVLRTHQENMRKPKRERIPWHITALGWKAYAGHKSALVRNAVVRHPLCPARVCARISRP